MSGRVELDVILQGAQAKAEAAQIDQSIDKIGDSAQSSSKTATQGLSGYEKALKSNRDQILQNNRQIAIARDELAKLNREILVATQRQDVDAKSVKALRDNYAQLSAQVKETQAKNAILAQENKVLESGAKSLKGAIDSETSAWSRKTNMLNTGQGALRGYDAIAQNLIRSAGGISIGMASIIQIGSALLPMLLNLGDAKKELIVLSAEEVSLNLLLAESYEAMSSKTFIAAQGLVAFEQNAQSVAEAGIAVNLLAIADAQQQVEKEARKISAAFSAIQDAKYAEGWGDMARMVEHSRDMIKESSVALAANQKVLAEQVGAMRALRDVYGLSTDQLVEFAKRAGASQVELDAMRRALNSDIDTLRDFAEEISKATHRTFNLAQAADRLKLALLEIPQPRISVEGLQGADGAVGRLQRAVDVVKAQGVTDPKQIALGVPDEAKSLIEIFKQQAAGLATTKAEALKLYESFRDKLKPELALIVQLNESAAKRMSVFADSTQAAAVAARRHAAEVRHLEEVYNSLQKRIQEAESALQGDTFQARRDKIAQSILAEAKAEVIRKDAVKANQAEIQNMTTLSEVEAIGIKLGLNKSYFDQLGKLQSALDRKVTAEKIEAEFSFIDKVTQLKIQNIEDEKTRRQVQIEFEIRAEENRLKLQFGNEADYSESLNELRREKYAALNKWQRDEQAKHNKAILELSQQLAEESSKVFMQVYGKGIEDTFKLIIDRGERELDRVASLARKFEGRGAAGIIPPDLNKVADIDATLQRLGITFDELAGRSGYATANIDATRRALERIEKIEKGGFGNILSGELGQIADKFNLANIAAYSFVDALQQAFTQAIVYGKNFVEVFGKVLLAGILSAIGQQAIAVGTMHILQGTAKLFSPWSAADGAREIAAGAALVAFGSALVAGAAAITASLDKNRSTAAGGAASSGGSSAPPQERTQPIPQIIFPTSGRSQDKQQPSEIHIHLDPGASKNFLKGTLDGYGVITAESAVRKHSKILQSAVKR